MLVYTHQHRQYSLTVKLLSSDKLICCLFLSLISSRERISSGTACLTVKPSLWLMYSGDLLRTCSENLHGINTSRPWHQQSEYLGKDVSKLAKEREKKSLRTEKGGAYIQLLLLQKLKPLRCFPGQNMDTQSYCLTQVRVC